MQVNDDYLTEAQAATLKQHELLIRDAVEKLALKNGKLKPEEAHLHAAMLAEFWSCAQAAAFAIDNLSQQPELLVTLKGDTPETITGHDFATELRLMLDELKFHAKIVEDETLDGLVPAFRWEHPPKR